MSKIITKFTGNNGNDMRLYKILPLMAVLVFPVFLQCSKNDSPTGEGALYGSHKPYTRWWWFSSKIDKDDVRDQLVWLDEHGFGGVEIAWVYPMFLKDDTPHPDFLSPEWAEPVVYAKRVADSLGMGCDFTFGSLWPFSDVDLPEGDETRTYFDSVEVARRSYTWDHPKEARILNHLDKNAFRRYAEKMNRGLGEAYKGSRSGIFVDSWEVETGYIWTPGFGETFKAEHGYDIEPYLKEQTLMDASSSDERYDYMSTLSGYAMREFYIPFAENASHVGGFSRSQCAGAPTDLLTAYTLVDVPESEAILYEPSFSRIAASAATIAGKDVVSAETFTCLYGWTGLRYQGGRGRSPHQGEELYGDLKLVCDAVFANGVNQIFWHGFPFNKVGRADNWFYTTCEIGSDGHHSLGGDELTRFNRYMTTVSEYMSRGRNYSELAVYMPLEDAWMGGAYPKEVTDKMAWALGEYELRYIRTPETFKGMQPLWVNGHFLSEAEFSDGLLRCGQATFKSLCLDVDYLDYSSLKEILRLARSGLPVYIGRMPEEPGRVKHQDYGTLLEELTSYKSVTSDASALISKPLVEGKDIPDFWCRQDGDDYYIFFANPLSSTISYPLEYDYSSRDNGSRKEITVNHHGKSEPYVLEFHPKESILLHVGKRGIQRIDLGYIPEK